MSFFNFWWIKNWLSSTFLNQHMLCILFLFLTILFRFCDEIRAINLSINIMISFSHPRHVEWFCSDKHSVRRSFNQTGNHCSRSDIVFFCSFLFSRSLSHYLFCLFVNDWFFFLTKMIRTTHFEFYVKPGCLLAIDSHIYVILFVMKN